MVRSLEPVRQTGQQFGSKFGEYNSGIALVLLNIIVLAIPAR